MATCAVCMRKPTRIVASCDPEFYTDQCGMEECGVFLLWQHPTARTSRYLSISGVELAGILGEASMDESKRLA